MRFETRVSAALDFILKDVLGTLPATSSIIFLRAQPLPSLSQNHNFQLICNQTFKPWADILEQAGLKNSLEIPEQAFDFALYLPTRFKQENYYNLARLISILKPGGILISAAHNQLGAKSLEASLQQLGGTFQTHSKHHCRINSFEKTSDLNQELLKTWLALGSGHLLEGTDLYVDKACFSSDKIDPASELLVRAINDDLCGHGADLGAGYGYISRQLLLKTAKIDSLALYEAEYIALACAKKNLQNFAAQKKLEFEWHDVTCGLKHNNLDWIVMNPPFHDMSENNTALGRKFIASAFNALKPGGHLYLVFNAHLPYTDPLKASFKSIKILAQTNTFKVVEAKK